MRVKQKYLALDREIKIYVLLLIMRVITALILRNIIASREIGMYSGVW